MGNMGGAGKNPLSPPGGPACTGPGGPGENANSDPASVTETVGRREKGRGTIGELRLRWRKKKRLIGRVRKIGTARKFA